ncbi:MAG TPA: TMEM175 family protein [Pyrinomonadaceae bacterium]|nr:TMEM175 family protein [Pyrinomonadaceae bacterium]
MNKNRLEAFSDGVIAILITIMVLELRIPEGADWKALASIYPVFLTYVLSFIYLGIYWNNHHHLLQATEHVDGRALWANLHLLFWLSLIPFVTAWMGENNFSQWPVALYGAVLLLAAIAYTILVWALLAAPGNELLAEALGSDFKGKISMVIYGVAIPLAFVKPWISCLVYIGVAAMWLIPDRRIERKIT